MPEERPRFGRFDQHHQLGSCVSGARRLEGNCPACAPRGLRPYRVVRRYRGDQIARDLGPSGWCNLWRLQTSDVSWPGSRQG
jgi:hypothetical protein